MIPAPRPASMDFSRAAQTALSQLGMQERRALAAGCVVVMLLLSSSVINYVSSSSEIVQPNFARGATKSYALPKASALPNEVHWSALLGTINPKAKAPSSPPPEHVAVTSTSWAETVDWAAIDEAMDSFINSCMAAVQVACICFLSLWIYSKVAAAPPSSPSLSSHPQERETEGARASPPPSMLEFDPQKMAAARVPHTPFRGRA